MAAVNGYEDYFDLTHGYDARKVSYSASAGSNVMNEGNTDLFKKDEMGKESFLNLLVAQLKYQDPLNPAEDTQFVTQLAQFSQLEFTQNSTEAIASLASNMQAFMDMQTLQAQSITNASATPLLGKEVRVMEAGFDHKGLSGREFNIHLTDGNKNGTVVIRDKDKNIIAELEVAAESSKGGDVKVKWDGKDTATDKLVIGGQYTIEVLNATGSGNAGYAYKEGTVSGVSFSSSGAGLTIDGVQYGLGYLVSVDKDDTSTASDGSNKSYNISDDVIKTIASIMNSKDDKDAIEKIAKALGAYEKDALGAYIYDDYGNKIPDTLNDEVSKVVEILNKDISDDDMIKRLADLLGQEDENYAEMVKKVKNTLG